MTTSRSLAIAVLGGVFACAGASALAQRYPTKPIRVLVPFSPGGGTDIIARLTMPRLAEALSQGVVIENRTGGGGYIAAEAVAKAAPDGYTLFFTAANLVFSLSFFPKQPVDPVRDFAPVSLLVKEPSVLAVHPSLPVKSVKELVALAKANPGKLNYASGGVGTSPHLNTELFKMMAHVNMVHVPYNGVGPATIGAIVGESQVILAPVSAVFPQAKAGKLRALAITLGERSEALPGLPALAETLPGFAAFQWYGVLAPRETPEAIVAALNKELVKIMQIRELRTRLIGEGSVAVGSTPQEFGVHIRDEKEKWAKVVKASGAKSE